MSAISDSKTETRVCEKHGPFRCMRVEIFGKGISVGNCNKCAEERDANAERLKRDEEIQNLFKKSTIPPRFSRKSLDTYVPETDRKQQAKETCFAYLRDIQNKLAAGACLTLTGPPGVGKTHLLVGILAGAIRSLVQVRYVTAVDFLASISGNWAWHGDNDQAKALIRVPLLALDEVWSPPADRDRESLVALVDARYREGRPTLVATNLGWSKMRETLGERLCDRLRDDGGKVLALDGESHRA